jgi:MGT family glycosyltransferase
LTEVLLTEGQRLLSGAGCGGLVCDQKVAGAGSVAMALGLKHITLSSALLRYEHPWITTSVISYEDQFLRPSLHSWFAKRIERFFQRRAFRPVLERIHRYRSDHGLPQITNLNGEDSPHAHLLPQPRCFEPLAPDLPEHFHFAGPWTAPSIRPGDGDSWRDLERRLDGRPLVYATLGTLARDHELLRAVAAACATLPVQLLIAAGGDPSLLDGLEGDPIVVASAPQLEVLERASAVVCHGGLNTTLEALARGVPVVAIPRAYDQGGVAARIEWSGCGVAVPLRRANLRNLREALLRVLEDSAPRGAAQRAAQEMRQSGGVAAAAEIAERALVGP